MQRTHPTSDLLNPERVDEFFETGYLVVREVFSPAEVRQMREAFERLEATARSLEQPGMYDGTQFVIDPADDGDNGDTRIRRIVWAGGTEPTLSQFGKDPRLICMAAGLLESPVVEQIINQAHFKFPDDEVTFEWHQDSKHRRYGTDLWDDVTGWGSFVETATAIDPMTRNNGPLRFIPGTHELGHIEPDPATGTLPESVFDESEAITLTLSPGDVALFGPFVIHGSGPNHSDGSRRLFLNGFAHPEANDREYPGVDAGRHLSCPTE